MQAIKLSKKLLGFSLYDFANSAYILIFNAYLFPIYFKEKVLLDAQNSDLVWGFVLSASLISTLLIGPILGLYGDRFNRKRQLLLLALVVGSGMLLLSLIPTGNIVLYTAIFIITNISFILSLSIYDSFIVHISDKSERNITSTFAWGFGYIGGVLSLAIIILFNGDEMTTPNVGLLSTTIFYLFFTSIALILLPKQIGQNNSRLNFKEAWQILKFKHFGYLLIGIWLISESIDVIVYFTSLYSRSTLNISTEDIGVLLLIVQTAAFPATWLMGVIANRYGVRRAILGSVILWLVLIIGLIISQDISHIIILAVPLTFVIGSTSALLRAHFSNEIPAEYSSFGFSVYSILTRVMTLIGAPLFGVISVQTGSQRMAMLSTIITLLLGVYFWNKSQSARLEPPSSF